MVRETRHLWVGNLPENIREDRIREHFKRYGRVQSVKILARGSSKDSLSDHSSPGGSSSGGSTLGGSGSSGGNGGTGGNNNVGGNSTGGSSSSSSTGSQSSSGGGVGGGSGLGGASISGLACTVAFMDIKSAAKAHTAEHKLDDRTLTTEYYEPTAIISAATNDRSPQSVVTMPSGCYSTSPVVVSQRFPPNSHGSSEDHSSFSERFYERSASRVVTDPEYLRRPGYHDQGPRGRARDRLYRGNTGPYASLIDRRAAWSYETSSAINSSRYTSSTISSSIVSEPASYTPSSLDSSLDTRRIESSSSSSTLIPKKKTKSRSGSESPSGSTSSRSPSRSRSTSPSTSSATGTSSSRASSSPVCSPGVSSSRGGAGHGGVVGGTNSSQRTLQSAVSAPSSILNSNSSQQPPTYSEDRRPLAICVRNLPARSSDTSLKDGLFHEYKKHGKVTWVKVVGQSSDRYALVCFKKADDVEKALEVSYDKLFFGCKIEVAPYQGYDVDDNELRPYEAELDEYHPKATRTLFIGNLEKDVTASELRKHFEQFGEIIEVDIKKQGAISSYAFCQYADIASVVKAIRTMDGEHLGNNRIKLGFGKSMPTNCVWVDGVSDLVSDKYLSAQFHQFGAVTQVTINRERGHALIFFDQIPSAQAAVKERRGFPLRGRKLQVDFASRECQEAFFEHLEKQSGGVGSVVDRVSDRQSSFDSVREPASRNFDSANSVITNSSSRFRYETSTRPRASSYSRSSASVCQNAIPSPSSGNARARLQSRYADYYESGSDYQPSERQFRNYDEFSQGSTDDLYEHDSYVSETPTLQSVVVAAEPPPSTVSFAPPDIRHLQKERVHLLEQLEECPSSGDEHISPKKRLKLDMQYNDSSLIGLDSIETNHKSSSDLRRLSESSRHSHVSSRRPSTDSGSNCRPIVNNYIPHSICKRRKTAGSVHHQDISGGESVDGSRPGTPLCDERPENLVPCEPRRFRERTFDGPISLPLPKFAAQFRLSTAGYKSAASVTSPPSMVTAAPLPPPPSPVHVPPPASPPPRPPSLSSNSSDSDVAPASPSLPSLDERIKSVVEKYEKWSGSRTLSAAGGDVLAKLDASVSEKFRFRHKLLDIDLKEVPPSEIVKSVLAKRSVFDEDSKRLENFGEKYEPREFVRTSTTVGNLLTPSIGGATGAFASTVQQSIYNNSPGATALKTLPGTSPKLPPAKGLQYPFPSHPPTAMPSTPTTPATPGTPGVLPSISSASTTCTVIPSELRSAGGSNGSQQQTTAQTVVTVGATNSVRKTSISSGASPSVGNNNSCERTNNKTVPNRTSLSVSTSTANKLCKFSDSEIKSHATSGLQTNIPLHSSESSIIGSGNAVTNVTATSSNSSTCLTTSTTASTIVSTTATTTTTTTMAASLTSTHSTTSSQPSTCFTASSSSSNSSSSIHTTTSLLNHHVQSLESTNTSATLNNNNNQSSNQKTKSIQDNSSSKICANNRSNSKDDNNKTILMSPNSYKQSDNVNNRIPPTTTSLSNPSVSANKSNTSNQQSQLTNNSSNSSNNLTPMSRKDRKNSSNKCDSKESCVESTDKKRDSEINNDEEQNQSSSSSSSHHSSKRKDNEKHLEEQKRKEREEKERLEKELMEKERLEKERLEKERQLKERQERERLERERNEKEKQERERLERERKREREDRLKREREEQERIEFEKQKKQEEEERLERERLEKERVERERQEKLEKEKRDKIRDDELRHEKSERRHKDELSSHDNKRKDKDEHKHKENHIGDDVNKSKHYVRESHDLSRKDSSKEHDNNIKSSKELHDNVQNYYDSRKESETLRNNNATNERRNSDKHNHVKSHHEHDSSKSRHHNTEKDTSSIANKKELTNQHKHAEISRHSSIDSDKSVRQYSDQNLAPNRIDNNTKDNSLTGNNNKKKERNNSSPSAIGVKRRYSSQEADSLNDISGDAKRLKTSDHKKLSDRRDSKDSTRSAGDRPKHKHGKNNFTKVLEDKIREDKRIKENNTAVVVQSVMIDEKKKDHEKDKERDLKHKQQRSEKHKSKNKIKERENSHDSPTTPKTPSSVKDVSLDKEFLSRLDLKLNNEDDKLKHNRKDKRNLNQSKQYSQESDDRKSCSEDAKYDESSKKKEKHERKSSRDESIPKSEERRVKKEERRARKITNSSDTTDSDEPKKHSIFDIEVEPAYISMYDKVKARSCKNMQKQEEEKRQEKIKAKFSQLKQSRAKREEKKRSTSWDEDSDSDERTATKQNRRGNKLMITSSSEDENGSQTRKKRTIKTYSDSDSDRRIQNKHEQIQDSSDDENNIRRLSRKGSKSRIASDTSDEEQTKKLLTPKIKTERYSDSEVDHGFADTEDKVEIKEEKFNVFEDKYIKKEKTNRMSIESSDDESHTKKHLAEYDNCKVQESLYIKDEIKQENNKFDRLAMMCDASSEGEHVPQQKDLFVKSENRKKHKKKQKRLKNSSSDENRIDLNESIDKDDDEKFIKTNSDRKKHNKKDKKRDKVKIDGERVRDKTKKSKKSIKLDSSKSENNSTKRDEKMQDIFGPFSDDSENGIQKDNYSSLNNSEKSLNSFYDRNKMNSSNIYESDSDSIDIPKSPKVDELREKEKIKDENKKRKEKKRKDREHRRSIVREENENSVDLVEAGKALEAKLMDDSEVTDDLGGNQDEIEIKIEPPEKLIQQTPVKTSMETDVFRFTDGDDNSQERKDEKKEIKEKKKKRKKSKEEKHAKKDHHHHHHHYKDEEKLPEKIKSTEIKKEIIIETDFEEETIKSTTTGQSSPGLPSLLDIPSPTESNKSPSVAQQSNFTLPKSPPSHVDSSPLTTIPKIPNKTVEKKKFIPGFGSDIDETIHENAVKSISSDYDSSVLLSPKSRIELVEDNKKSEKDSKNQETVDDKPRVVISQEETEDAVAALLGESFGGSGNEFDSYNDVTSPTTAEDTISNNTEEVTSIMPAEDDEEMRQAVQSLSTTADIEVKPDTPLSEHELQIDTDTDDNEDSSVQVAYEQMPKTPEMLDFSQPPKTPDVATNYTTSEISLKATQNEESKVEIVPEQKTSTNDTTPTLVPIPPLVKTCENITVPEKIQQPSVISKPWSLEQKSIDTMLPLPPLIVSKPIDKSKLISSEATSVQTTVIAAPKQAARVMSYAVTSKITEAPTLSVFTPQKSTAEIAVSSIVTPVTIQTIRVQPAAISSTASNILQTQTTSSTVATTPLITTTLNRLPITPVLAPISSKLIQPQKIILPQSMQPTNLPKLVPTQRYCAVVTTSSEAHTAGTKIFASAATSHQMFTSANVTAYPQTIRIIPQQTTARFTSSTQQTITSPVPCSPITPIATIAPETKSMQTSVVTVTPPTIKVTESCNLTSAVTSTTSVLVSTNSTLSVTDVKTESRTLTPSPVIVTTVKETPSPVIVTTPSIKDEPVKEEPPTENKLSAIEIATKELNMQLIKEKEDETLKHNTDIDQKLEIKSELPLVELEEQIKNEKLSVEIKSDLINLNEVETIPVLKTSIESESVSVIKEMDITRFDDDKTEDTESGISDMSKENMRLSADILENKDDPLDSKEDSDYWSAKEVNIESVIKTVDALCSADELSEGSEVGKEDWYDAENKSTESDIKSDKSLSTCSDMLDKPESNNGEDYQTKFDNEHDLDNESEQYDEGIDNCQEERETGRISRRGGRGMRGRKVQTKSVDRGTLGVQTRRSGAVAAATGRKENSASVPPPTMRNSSRGGAVTRTNVTATTPSTIPIRSKPDRRIKRDDSEQINSDVYEFRDDSEENKNHPRLIMTIKSSNCGGNVATTTPTVVVKEAPPVVSPIKISKPQQEFVSPGPNTRKSARLQERDGSRNTVDDTIEDVVKNMVTRSGLQINIENNLDDNGRSGNIITRAQANVPLTRRAARQNVGKSPPSSSQVVVATTPEPKKVGRGRKGKDRRASDTTDDSSEEKGATPSIPPIKEDVAEKAIESSTTAVTAVSSPKPSQLELRIEDEKKQDLSPIALSRKEVMMRRLKNEEPQTLIDPVTGHLLVMKESEGHYITISTVASTNTTNTISGSKLSLSDSNGANISNAVLNSPAQDKGQSLIVNQSQQQPVIVKDTQSSQPTLLVQQNTVITSSSQPISSTTVTSKPPQSLKAHVLSSQAAKAAISQLQSFQNPLNQSQPIQKSQQIQNPIVINTPTTQHQQQQQQSQSSPIQPQQFIIKTAHNSIPLNQNLNVNVSLAASNSNLTINLSPRQSSIPHNIPTKMPPMSPNIAGIQNPKQHLLQSVKPQTPQSQQQPPTSINATNLTKLSTTSVPMNPKAYFLNAAVNQGLNVSSTAPIQLVKSSPINHRGMIVQQNHIQPQPMLTAPTTSSIGIGNVSQSNTKQLLIGQSPSLSSVMSAVASGGKPPTAAHAAGLHQAQQQQIMTGAVASPPPLNKQHIITQQPIVAGASSGRILVHSGIPPPIGVNPKIDPTKLDPTLSAAGCVLVAHPSQSPQARVQGMQPDLPIPAYEASLHGVSDRTAAYTRSRQPSPPPAHQQMSPAAQGDSLSHLGPPNPYMSTHMYQQYLRSQPRPYQLSRSPHMTSGLEKANDGQEGEEAPVTSPPPLELRRPASRGTPYGTVMRPSSAAGLRTTTVVPLGLPSPHGLTVDRTTDSPQVAAVYMHGARMLHYAAAPTGTRFYESPGEPPPAHRAHSAGPPLPGVAHASAAAASGYLHQAPPGIMGLPTQPPNILVAPRHGSITESVEKYSSESIHRAIHLTTSSPHIGQVDSLFTRLKDHPIMWQGLLALKNDTAAVQMYYVFGNRKVAEDSLPFNADGSTPPLRIAQRMRLDKLQIEGVARKLGEEKEHCMLLALPCGQDRDDVVKQSNNLTSGFIKYLQEKQAAGIVNIAAPGSQQAAFVVHMFPSCDFANDYLQRTAPQLFSRVASYAHLIIIIATV